MFIKEIIIDNFKIYYQKNEIKFQKDKNRNIFIISGLNGYGKTTFLTALVWCLYGQNMRDVDKDFKRNIIECGGYKNFAINNLNRAAKIEGTNSYSVKLILSDIVFTAAPSREISICRKFDTKLSEETLSILIDGNENELTKEVGPEIFINDYILPKEIAKFFFFDSEKIVEFAEIKSIEEKRSLSKAYSEILGIKKYEDLKSNLKNLRMRFVKDMASDLDKRKIEDLEREVVDSQNLIDVNRDKIKVLEEEREIKKKTYNYLQERLIKEGASVNIEKIIESKQHRFNLLQELEELNHKLKGLLDLAPFAIALNLFSEVKTQVEKEKENALNTTAKVYIKKKVKNFEKELDILTMPAGIDSKKREVIKAKISELINRKLLLEDNLNNDKKQKLKLHGFSEKEADEFNAVFNNVRFSFKSKFDDLGIKYKELKNRINKINRYINDSESKEDDPIIKEFRQKMKVNEERINNIEKEINDLLAICEFLKNEINNKQKNLIVVAKKVSFDEENEKKDKIVIRLINKLDEFIVKLKNSKKESLEKNMLDNFNSLMHKRDFVKKVKVYVDSDILDIDLFDKLGNLIIKDNLSKGEQQLYATALLKTLVEESSITFPVFIDSPLQKFDYQHTKNIITKFYPSISNQVVLFPLLEKELNHEEMQLLDKRINLTYVIDNFASDCSQIKPIRKENLFDFFH